MFLIFKLFFTVVGFFFLMTIVAGLSLFSKVRYHMRQMPPGGRRNTPPPPPHGSGDIIEGEYKVLDEGKK